MLVGRDDELALIDGLLSSAAAGRGGALCFEGEPGIGRTALLDAAAAMAAGFTVVRAVGVRAEFGVAHSGLSDVVRALRPHLDELPAGQREALTAALGGTPATAPFSALSVGSALLALVSEAGRRRPVLLLVDDLQWVDPASVAALSFVARRLQDDAVVVLFARWSDDAVNGAVAGTDPLSGVPVHPVAGLDATAATVLLAGLQVSTPVATRLMVSTGGNPSGLFEAARALTREQRRGSAASPAAPPVGNRLADAFLESVRGLSPDAGRLLLIAAAATTSSVAPLLAALGEPGSAERALAELERRGVLMTDAGRYEFRHRLLGAAVWQRASAAARRDAHRALAAVPSLGPATQLRHRASAAVGFDEALAAELAAAAVDERHRQGFAAASALSERAAQLCTDPARATRNLADAVDDAVVAGDGQRARLLAAPVIADASLPAGSRGEMLLSLGVLEQHAGSVPAARELLTQAVGLLAGPSQVRALAELTQVGYRLGAVTTVQDAAAALAAVADRDDPVQDMLRCFAAAVASGFTGDWTAGHGPALRAIELLESTPELRDEPRFLAISLLAAGWSGEPLRAETYLQRRIDAARSRGAVGVLPLALSMVAAAAQPLGRHHLAYALAGEVVELGSALGYAADVGTAHEVLAWELAARGRVVEAQHSIGEARRLAAIADITEVSVHGRLADAFCALCRQDYDTVVGILEARLVADGGRRPRGDYPLSVAPDLVEAYLALGRSTDAHRLAAEHIVLHQESDDPEIIAHRNRIAGLVAETDEAVETFFQLAYLAHQAGGRPFDAARTRLLHGSRLRRSGQRIAARHQLRSAREVFAGLGFDAWTARADAELGATGARSRAPAGSGDALTSQETRVALGVARGQTNREIAAALFLSPKTVEHHVTSVLRKRGLRSRTELAVFDTIRAQDS